MDLSTVSSEELRTLHRDVKARLTEAQAAACADAREQIRQICRANGIKLGTLATLRRPGEVAVKGKRGRKKKDPADFF